MTKEDLIKKVNSNPQLLSDFQSGWDCLSIEEYLENYSYIPDIVDKLACDLGVENVSK